MEADSHLGVANRLAAPLARRVALAFPLAGPHRPALPGDRPPGEPGRDLGHAHGRPAGLRDRPRGHRRPGRRRQPGRPQPEPRRRRGLRQRAPAGRHPRGRPGPAGGDAAPARRARARRRATGWSAGSTTCRARSPPRTWWCRARAARCSSWRRSAGPRSSCRTRTPRPTTRPRTPAGCPRPAPPSSSPTHECTGEHLRGLVGALLSDRHRLDAMAEAARAAGRPDAADRVAEEALAIARRPRRRLPRPRRPRSLRLGRRGRRSG